MKLYSFFLKRFFDIVLSLIGLIILLPIVIISAVFLIISNRSTPFFFQPRPGLNGKIFKVIKLKTMSDAKDENGNLLSDDIRLTKTGIIIRKLSFDEIPQLVNVIKGDMSLVGPRPLLIRYLQLYNEKQARRHEIKPGITGWAQVNGRNAISWQEKFELDVWYVDNVNIFLDIKILLLTVKKVFIREGISSDSSSTMEAFEGN